MNDLVFESNGADHKILQILVQSEEKVKMVVGISDLEKPHPNFTSEIPMIAEKKDGYWRITKTGLATSI